MQVDKIVSEDETGPVVGRMVRRRKRSEGVLNAEELARCRKSGVKLAYDAMQTGWVTACALDDLSEDHAASPVTRRAARAQTGSGHTGPLSLRRWTPADVDRFHHLLNDTQVWTYLPEDMPDPFTRDIAAALIELSNASNHHEVHAVLRGDEIVGQVRLLFDDADLEDDAAEISYWLGRAYWRQGIASQMVKQFARRALSEHPGLPGLFARYHHDNLASARVLAKAGFTNERPDPKDPAWRRVSLSRRMA